MGTLRWQPNRLDTATRQDLAEDTRVQGYRHLPKLRDALQRELKIDTTTSKKEAA